MTQQQTIAKGDTLQRISSAGFITAAILMVIGNLLMPYTTTPTSDLQEMRKPLGEHELRAEASSLLVTIGFLAMMIGVTGVYPPRRNSFCHQGQSRTAKLCSRCNGVCVHIQLPGDLDKKLIDTDSPRISETAVDDFSPKPVEIYPAPGAPRSVETADRGVQVLKVKFIRYNRKGGSD